MSKEKDKSRNMLFLGWFAVIVILYLFMIIAGIALGRAISYFLGVYK